MDLKTFQRTRSIHKGHLDDLEDVCPFQKKKLEEATVSYRYQ